MGRPRNQEETKQLSIKMPASERQRLLEVAFHVAQAEGKAESPDDVNLSQWVREQLALLVSKYEGQYENGRVVIEQTYRDAVRRDYERRLAAMD